MYIDSNAISSLSSSSSSSSPQINLDTDTPIVVVTETGAVEEVDTPMTEPICHTPPPRRRRVTFCMVPHDVDGHLVDKTTVHYIERISGVDKQNVYMSAFEQKSSRKNAMDTISKLCHSNTGNTKHQPNCTYNQLVTRAFTSKNDFTQLERDLLTQWTCLVDRRGMERGIVPGLSSRIIHCRDQARQLVVRHALHVQKQCRQNTDAATVVVDDVESNRIHVNTTTTNNNMSREDTCQAAMAQMYHELSQPCVRFAQLMAEIDHCAMVKMKEISLPMLHRSIHQRLARNTVAAAVTTTSTSTAQRRQPSMRRPGIVLMTQPPSYQKPRQVVMDTEEFHSTRLYL